MRVLDLRYVAAYESALILSAFENRLGAGLV